VRRVAAGLAPGIALSQGLAPVLGVRPWLLILGSLPGAASLAAQQYYAHPRNLFWPLMGHLFAAGPALPYAQRLQALGRAGVALWDVLHSASRRGSLDADIDARSATANDLSALLSAQPQICCVAFNGKSAATLFQRHGRTQWAGHTRRLTQLTLPSTSPAHAALSAADKLQQWQQLLALRPKT
jgi:double-stranded uracil-DNA glycosylase